MAKRRGRPAKYVHDRDGRPVVGLSLHKLSGRYYATHAEKPVYFGSDMDLAIARFRAWEHRTATVSLPSPRPLLPLRKKDREAAVAEGWIKQEDAEKIVDWPERITESAVWGWLRDQIIDNPTRAAQRLGIPEIAYLTEIKRPEPSVKLADVVETYICSKKNLSSAWARKSRLFWREFVEQVDKRTFRDVAAEDIERYHDHVWRLSEADHRSPTWVNHRLSTVRTIIRYCLKKQKDVANVRRVLDLTEVFETKRKNGVDPRPIEPQHFAKLLTVADVKWKAVYLLALNACLYPKELAEVRKSELDLKRKTLIARRGKTGLIRCAVLWGRTVRAIRAYMKAEPHNGEYLFVSANGDKYSENHIGRNHRRRRTDANLPDDVTFDMIRDGAYTAVIEAGFDLQTARLIAGHATGMSDAYVRRCPRMVAEACAAIEKAYFS